MGLTKHYNKIPFRELKDEALEANGTGGFLTKPCPLMPDGKWVKVTQHLSWDSDTSKMKSEVSYSETVSGLSVSVANPDSKISTFLKLSTASGYRYGEVRCIIQGDDPTVAIPLQASTAWYVLTDGQSYYSYNYTGTFESAYGADGNVYVNYYTYLVPIEE